MAKKVHVQSDDIGLFVVNAGQVVRPIAETVHAKGDQVEVRQCSGSVAFGVGRDGNAKMGVWQDFWLGCEIKPEADLDAQREAFQTLQRIGSSEVHAKRFISARKSGLSAKDALHLHPALHSNDAANAASAIDMIPSTTRPRVIKVKKA